jgi:hypothetical protein
MQKGTTALSRAAATGIRAVVQLLLEDYKVDVEENDSYAIAALHA